MQGVQGYRSASSKHSNFKLEQTRAQQWLLTVKVLGDGRFGVVQQRVPDVRHGVPHLQTSGMLKCVTQHQDRNPCLHSRQDG